MKHQLLLITASFAIAFSSCSTTDDPLLEIIPKPNPLQIDKSEIINDSLKLEEPLIGIGNEVKITNSVNAHEKKISTNYF